MENKSCCDSEELKYLAGLNTLQMILISSPGISFPTIPAYREATPIIPVVSSPENWEERDGIQGQNQTSHRDLEKKKQGGVGWNNVKKHQTDT